MLSSLNGVAPSWSEIQITVNVTGGPTLTVIDIKSIDHESAIARGEQRGASGGRVLKRTTGALTNTASAEFYRDGSKALKRELALVAPKDAAGRPQISKVAFDVVIKHSYDDDADIHVTKLLGCHYDKDGGKHAEGTDAETVAVDLNPIDIVETIDGQDVVLL
jgi:hypothetical protein